MQLLTPTEVVLERFGFFMVKTHKPGTGVIELFHAQLT